MEIEITPIIVAIIAAVGAIISAIIRNRENIQNREKLREPNGNIKIKEVKPRPSIWTIVMVGFIAVNIASLGYLGIIYSQQTPSTEITITYPYDGAIVDLREIIRGTSQRIPEEYAIWVVVYAGNYYPQGDTAAVQANGDWSSVCHIGREEDVGKKFDIIAVLVNKNVQYTFHAYVTQQTTTNGTWPGFESLPDGAVEYDFVTVTRK